MLESNVCSERCLQFRDLGNRVETVAFCAVKQLTVLYIRSVLFRLEVLEPAYKGPVIQQFLTLVEL